MTIAIVIPVYRHSVLLYDAIASLRDGQRSACDIILVDDGCPDPATMLAGLGLSALDQRIQYIRSGNRGLSGARNRGIEFVLAGLPGAEAIFFLDADNALSPWSLSRMTHVLADDPEADWFYPDIRMFGLEWDGDFAGPYTVLAHVTQNICEAGSLVRRRVFEAGTRFSEQMRLGHEDWDFWLSAVEAGFRGRHFSGSGFRYRKRPESMVANSSRDAVAIRDDLEKRHAWTRDLRTMLALEHAECPRYAIYLWDLHLVRLTSSADGHTEEMTWPDYVIRFWRGARAPHVFHSGAMLIVTTSTDMRLLRDAKLWYWAVSDLESRLRDCNIACLTIRPTVEGRFGIGEASAKLDHDARHQSAAFAAITMQLLREVVLDATDDWIASAGTPEPGPRTSRRDVLLPPSSLTSQPQHGALRSLVVACLELRRSDYSTARYLPGTGMQAGTPDRSGLHRELRMRFGGGLLPPALHERRVEIAYILPLVEFGGVEKTTIHVAAALKALGHATSLIVLKARTVYLAPAVMRAFDRVIFMDNAEFHNFTGPRYLGTNLTRWSVAGDHADAVNLLSVFDAVITAHAADALGLMGELRRRGVVTASHLQVFDRTDTGRPVGHPVLTVAFEHALDLVITCSRRLSSEMHALGVPWSKITLLPNASSLEVAQARLYHLRDVRRARAAKPGVVAEPLRVLFLGRIDRQKGIDHLVALHANFSTDARIWLRFIGKPVMDNPPYLGTLAEALEDPVYETHDLLAAYAWADVLVLPSLWEGLPLTLFECMSVGVVPIATRVGAVDEAIRDGIDGWIVNLEDCPRKMIARIEQLADDRTRLNTMSDAAFEAMQGRNWNESVRQLDQDLRRLIDERSRVRTSLPQALLPVPVHASPDAPPPDQVASEIVLGQGQPDRTAHKHPAAIPGDPAALKMATHAPAS